MAIQQEGGRRDHRRPYSDRLRQVLESGTSKPVGTRDSTGLPTAHQDGLQPHSSEYELSDGASIDDENQDPDEGEEDGPWEVESDRDADRELERRVNSKQQVSDPGVIYTLTV
ncbi:uncharacterized protein PFLUO_LOCUS5871, partial [Penicillium psychrofluorescens]|uniref:uncharacterized protein n=1 Tax=Penicillium psychrofluorescens TaxID=3158075 RepID=UPI003CCD19EB